MSKQIKQNCQKMIIKLLYKLEELRVFVKMKKSQSTLEKFVTQIINQFKYFHDEFEGMCIHNSYLQKKSDDQHDQIQKLRTQLLTKNAQKKMCDQIMKSKYQKMVKEQKFLEFTGKNMLKQPPRHQRHQSELIKKGLSQLQKDILQSNNRVSHRVKELQQQIQNQQQRYLTFENTQLSKNVIPDLELSRILPQKRNPCDPNTRTLEKKIKIRNIQLDFGDDITAYKSTKRQLSSRGHKDSKIYFDDNEQKSSQTVIVNIKKKDQLAQLISQQTKVIVSREKYFSTDL